MCIRDSLWAGIEEYAGADSDLAGPVQAALLETYGHVVTHMKRLPDARWLVRESRVRLVEERLGSLRPVSYTHLDVYKRQP